MKRYGNLFQKIINIDNLRLAHQSARKGKIHRSEVIKVDSDIDTHLYKIQKQLMEDVWFTSEYKLMLGVLIL